MAAAHRGLAVHRTTHCYRSIVSDATTALIARDQLTDLLHAMVEPTAGRPALAVSAHLIPRAAIDARGALERARQQGEATISPLVLLVVLAMLVMMFVSIIEL
jgi:hypothetical protein